MSSIAAHLKTHPPRCLSDIHAKYSAGAVDGETERVTFDLSGTKKGDPCRVVGYDLSAYNKDYDGPLTFISPLYLEALGEKRKLIFDSDIHGYHGELQDSAKLRGKGEPTAYRCPKCNNDLFFVQTIFDYHGAAHDLWADEPDTNIENYFENLKVTGKCSRCHVEAEILDMDL